jgi:hypothetical protein
MNRSGELLFAYGGFENTSAAAGVGALIFQMRSANPRDAALK